MNFLHSADLIYFSLGLAFVVSSLVFLFCISYNLRSSVKLVRHSPTKEGDGGSVANYLLFLSVLMTNNQ